MSLPTPRPGHFPGYYYFDNFELRPEGAADAAEALKEHALALGFELTEAQTARVLDMLNVVFVGPFHESGVDVMSLRIHVSTQGSRFQLKFVGVSPVAESVPTKTAKERRWMRRDYHLATGPRGGLRGYDGLRSTNGTCALQRCSQPSIRNGWR